MPDAPHRVQRFAAMSRGRALPRCASASRSLHCGQSGECRMLQGKAAVVTGSTSGTGLGIAKSLAAQGCSILVNGLVDDDMAKQAVKEIRAHNVNVATYCGDLSKPSEVEAMVGAANK